MTKALHERYPKIFAEHCEINTGPGWYNILDSACAAIQNHIENAHRQHEIALKFKAMADDLRAGNDAPFFEHHRHWDPVKDHAFLDRRRQEIMDEDHSPTQEPCSQLVATQIKEKFGTLRFYHDGGDSFCDGVVLMAEVMSGCTCEDCGAPGRIGGKNWLATLCDPCRFQRES